MKKKNINLKNTQKVKQYNKALRASSKIQHVVQHQNGWAVKKSGANRASAVYEKQSTAIDRATIVAKNYGTSVLVHGRDGKIRNIRHSR
ncbi:DUF2188 domain-containing protein [Patescibacteria group bacterium]|nr:DUF2188 domain-containing protein [Patescibacteria group bacterium]MCG2701574.1 DUF2188 domain-containing protein [Candidatus Parcubacteria bacterium]MBU4264458.1 DUF2188 domain-containing protein [Patescibacteria group bacterium]MBU4390389.1 DUF2188 domain-containing protein [Patescibacteria group bacterium]MBU4396660.1 DUF2188 domain-containing protein [Patescibacteria group bacterium]